MRWRTMASGVEHLLTTAIGVRALFGSGPLQRWQRACGELLAMLNNAVQVKFQSKSQAVFGFFTLVSFQK